MKLVIDTNVFISAILKESTTRRLIVESDFRLLLPELVLSEIKEHEQEILSKSKLTKTDFLILINTLLKYLEIVPQKLLDDYKDEALKISKDIDINDTVFFACALCYDAAIWTNDKKLKNQGRVKVYFTKEIINLVGI